MEWWRRNKEMKGKKVSGIHREHHVLLYTLSTCAWCNRTKKFLQEQNVEYEYVDIDLLNRDDREQCRQEILKKGGQLLYPTIIVDEKTIINGFREETLREVLGL